MHWVDTTMLLQQTRTSSTSLTRTESHIIGRKQPWRHFASFSSNVLKPTQLQKHSHGVNEQARSTAIEHKQLRCQTKQWDRMGAETKKGQTGSKLQTDTASSPKKDRSTGGGRDTVYPQNITPWPTAQSPRWKLSSELTRRLSEPQLQSQNHPQVLARSPVQESLPKPLKPTTIPTFDDSSYNFKYLQITGEEKLAVLEGAIAQGQMEAC